MQIILIKKDKLYKYPFPNKNISSFFVHDNINGTERDLIEIAVKNGKC